VALYPDAGPLSLSSRKYSHLKDLYCRQIVGDIKWHNSITVKLLTKTPDAFNSGHERYYNIN
jgi:hypothetical protein